MTAAAEGEMEAGEANLGALATGVDQIDAVRSMGMLGARGKTQALAV